MLIAGIREAPSTFYELSPCQSESLETLADPPQLERGRVGMQVHTDFSLCQYERHPVFRFSVLTAGWTMPNSSFLGLNFYLGIWHMFPFSMPPLSVVDLYNSVIRPIKVQASPFKVFMAFHYLALCCET